MTKYFSYTLNEADKPLFYTKSENGIVTEVVRTKIDPYGDRMEYCIGLTEDEIEKYYFTHNGSKYITRQNIDEKSWVKAKINFSKIQKKEQEIDDGRTQAYLNPKPKDNSIDKLEERRRKLNRTKKKPRFDTNIEELVELGFDRQEAEQIREQEEKEYETRYYKRRTQKAKDLILDDKVGATPQEYFAETSDEIDEKSPNNKPTIKERKELFLQELKKKATSR